MKPAAKSLSVSMDRFEKKYEDYPGDAFQSSIHLRRKRGKATPWFFKYPPEPERMDDTSARIEVYSAWCYQIFVGMGKTQTKHYFVRDDSLFYVAVKEIAGFQGLAEHFSEHEQKLGEQFHKKSVVAKAYIRQQIIEQPQRLRQLAYILVEFLRQGGNDFRPDHIGFDNDGNLVRIDFGQASAALTHDTSLMDGLCFEITSADLARAPLFEDYKPNNYFTTLFAGIYGGAKAKIIFAELATSNEFKAAFKFALLKRLVFPYILEYAAIDVFDDDDLFREYTLTGYRRDRMLRRAALDWPQFVRYLREAEQYREQLIAELTSDYILRARPLRHIASDTLRRCITENVNCNLNMLNHQVKVEQTTWLNRFNQHISFEIARLQRARLCSGFFTKGYLDKIKLFKHIMQLITVANLSQIGNAFIIQLLKHIAIVAHHKRYSKINKLACIQESKSWQAFIELTEELPEQYQAQAQLIISDKTERTIPVGDSQSINSYNQYRKRFI